MSTDVEQVLDAFFVAIERADAEAVAACYADAATVWHSNDNITQTKQENLKTLSALTKVASLRYCILERVISGEQVAQRHRVEVTVRANGHSATLEAAIFFTVREGLIHHIAEYVDSAAIDAVTALFR